MSIMVKDLAAGRQHLADIGDAVLDATVARSDQRVVGDVDLEQLDFMLGRAQGVLGLHDAGRGGIAARRWRR